MKCNKMKYTILHNGAPEHCSAHSIKAFHFSEFHSLQASCTLLCMHILPGVLRVICPGLRIVYHEHTHVPTVLGSNTAWFAVVH